MMTFYTGEDHAKYDEMFEVICRYAVSINEGGSKAATFRWMVRKFYQEIERINGKDHFKAKLDKTFEELEPAEDER